MKTASVVVVQITFQGGGKAQSRETKEIQVSLFIQQRQKALSCTDKRARRWRPLIIRRYFQLYSSSPKAYQFL